MKNASPPRKRSSGEGSIANFRVLSKKLQLKQIHKNDAQIKMCIQIWNSILAPEIYFMGRQTFRLIRKNILSLMITTGIESYVEKTRFWGTKTRVSKSDPAIGRDVTR